MVRFKVGRDIAKWIKRCIIVFEVSASRLNEITGIKRKRILSYRNCFLIEASRVSMESERGVDNQPLDFFLSPSLGFKKTHFLVIFIYFILLNEGTKKN
jgi:hypothetical protein